MYDLQLSKPQILLYYKYKEFGSNAEMKRLIEMIIFSF